MTSEELLAGTLFSRAVPAVMLMSLLISMSVYHPYPYDNVVTRWALARQLVVTGSLRIDPFAVLTSDRAFSGGQYYSDKSFLPSAAAGLTLVPLDLMGLSSPPSAYPVGGIARYLAERLTVSIALLGLLLLLAKRCRREGLDPYLPLLALGLGSILLPYSTLLYAHVPAAFLLFASYSKQAEGRYATSDAMGALSVAWEYTLIVPYLIMLAYRGRGYWKSWRAFRPALLLLAALTPQMAHNWLAFGSPLTMGYSLETVESFPSVSMGFFGFTWPTPERLYRILLSAERGIFFYMPWAAFGLWGLLGGRLRRRKLRAEPLLIMVASYILLYSAQGASTAGWAYGQRYLIPMVPFLALGLGRFAAGGRVRACLAATAILPGILQALLGTFGEIHLPVHPVENPLPLPQWNVSLEMLLQGHHSFWLLGTVGAVLLSLAAVILWAMTVRRSGFALAGLSWIPVWLLLAAFSAGREWGGKTDYYRGVLAEHRREWGLAAEYYASALQDPSAPAIVEQRYRNALVRVESVGH